MSIMTTVIPATTDEVKVAINTTEDFPRHGEKHQAPPRHGRQSSEGCFFELFGELSKDADHPRLLPDQARMIQEDLAYLEAQVKGKMSFGQGILELQQIRRKLNLAHRYLDYLAEVERDTRQASELEEMRMRTSSLLNEAALLNSQQQANLHGLAVQLGLEPSQDDTRRPALSVGQIFAHLRVLEGNLRVAQQFELARHRAVSGDSIHSKLIKVWTAAPTAQPRAMNEAFKEAEFKRRLKGK